MSELVDVPLEALIQVAQDLRDEYARADRLRFRVPQRLRAAGEQRLTNTEATLELVIDAEGRRVWALPNRVVIDLWRFPRWAERQEWMAGSARQEVERLREVRDTLAEALRELECGWWATGTVPEMMENVRAIVRAAVDKADPPRKSV